MGMDDEPYDTNQRYRQYVEEGQAEFRAIAHDPNQSDLQRQYARDHLAHHREP